MADRPARPGHLDPADLARAAGRWPGAAGVLSALFERGGRDQRVAEICAMARAAGARTVVDGVSYAPHGFPDVPALGLRCLSVLGLQDLWPASGDHGDPPRPSARSCRRRGIISTRARCTSASRRPGRIMRRSRPVPGWPIISTRCTRIISAPRRDAGGAQPRGA